MKKFFLLLVAALYILDLQAFTSPYVANGLPCAADGLCKSTDGFREPTDSLSSEKLDSIIVSASWAGVKTPVAQATIGRKEIAQRAASHSLPMIVGFQPSVVATTEGGLGLGYSKFSVRGSDPTRTNVTLNGISLNNGEAQDMTWVNLPTLGSVLQSVQLQRGLGTSVNGPGAFGATFNMQTITPSDRAYGEAEASYGSYQTHIETIGAGTGILKSGSNNLFFDTKYSGSRTEGYIRNAKADLNFLFLQGGWFNEKNSLKLLYIFGDQSTGITWEGCPLAPDDMYHSNRRYNLSGEYYDDFGNFHYYDNETDNYTQHHLQLHYVHTFNKNLTFNATLHYTKGQGYYENYKYNAKFSKYGLDNQIVDGATYKKSDFIIRQYMDNDYYVASANFHYNNRALSVIGGLNYSFYDGNHFGRLRWCKLNPALAPNKEWYRNEGKKDDMSAFVKAEYQIVTGLTAYLDLQYRFIFYEMNGMDKDFVEMESTNHYNFFNPKAGLNYELNSKNRFYFSVAVGHKEPTRSDLKEAIKAGEASKMKKERMTDFELGYSFASKGVSLGANLYFMEYKDQLVATGKLTETGYTIQQNIPDSYRHGIELSALVRPFRNLEIAANLTLSKNKLRKYTLYTDTYDNPSDWNPVEQTPTYIKKGNLALSPELVSMASVNYSPSKSWLVGLNYKEVGKQYMDNSSCVAAKIPAYGVMGFMASKTFSIRGLAKMELSAHIDNLLNNRYYAYGFIYTSKFADGSADDVSKSVFPQARTNFLVTVALKF